MQRVLLAPQRPESAFSRIRFSRSSCPEGASLGLIARTGESFDHCGTTPPPQVPSTPSTPATLNGCRCQSSWDFEGAPQSGCVDSDDDPAGSWCVVDSPSCAAVPFGRLEDGRFFDYCAASRGESPRVAETEAGCRCQAKWWLPPQNPAYTVLGSCVATDEEGRPWCVVSESSCRFGKPAGRLTTPMPAHGTSKAFISGDAFDYCAEG